ncbi:MAG: hypothetical protein K2M64_04385, partial [Clostridia bacterium]|nr:hypothetical protein [Clostridia bacterium]
NIKKKRVWAACLCLLFALTTAIGLFALPVTTYAADGDNTPDTLKFKQVAAGDDFVIALTYNGDLYGWSLSKDPQDEHANDFNNSATTLGGYYPVKPHRINVTMTYATYNSDGSIYQSNITNPTHNRYIGGSDDKIKQIAATRTTAAFLTTQGLIYTWGKNDDTEPTNTNSDAVSILNLLHITEDAAKASKFVSSPTMISYNGTQGNQGTGAFMELAPSVTISNNRVTESSARVTSISASEYNYAAYYRYNSNNKVCIWGQTVYQQLGADNDFDKFAPATNKRWQTDVTYSDNGVVYASGNSIYLGDGNVYAVDNSHGLYVRGKNYTVKAGAALDKNNTKENGAYTYTKLDSKYVNNLLTTGDATDGYAFTSEAEYDKDTHSGHPDFVLENAVIKNFAQITSGVSVGGDYDAQFKTSDGENAVSTKVTKFSAGAGYGYLINVSGEVVAWGDTSLGQNKL